MFSSRHGKPDHKPPVKPKKPRTGIKKKFPKASGQLVTFYEIWNERPHACEVCNTPLRYFDIDYFSHLLPKKTYTKYKLEKKNIWLMCCNREDKCHDKWHNAYLGMALEEMWKPVFAEYERLKTEYNKLYLKQPALCSWKKKLKNYE